MKETILSLLITFAFQWHGRDKIWTPVFKGNPETRFSLAMNYYQEKMGFQETPLVFNLRPNERYINDPNRCASVEAAFQKLEGFDIPRSVVIVSWWGKGKGCADSRPEFWALHESCHIRYAHHLRQGFDEQKETDECMKLYSKKERR